MVETLYKAIEEHTGLSIHIQVKLLQTAVALVTIVVVKYFASRVVNSWSTETIKKIQWRRGFNIIANMILFIVLVEIWLGFSGSASTIIGLASAGIAIALRDPLANLAGWLYLEIRKPFKIGDRIQIGEHIGDVIDIRFLDFSILEIGNWVKGDQHTGRVLVIPNARTFSTPTANYTNDCPLIWNEINFEITYESNPKRALEIVDEIAKEYVQPLTPQERELATHYPHFSISIGNENEVFSSFIAPGKNGTQVSLRFLCRVHRRRLEVKELWTRILAAIAKEKDMQIAYETTRFYNRQAEGKSMFDGQNQ